MKLTKNQLERIFALYQGFGVSPGQQTPEITTDDEGHPSPSIAVHLRGYAIHVNHLGQVNGPPRAERWAAPAKRAWLAEAEAAIGELGSNDAEHECLVAVVEAVRIELDNAGEDQ